MGLSFYLYIIADFGFEANGNKEDFFKEEIRETILGNK